MAQLMRALVVAMVLAAFGLIGCGGTSSGYIPVESPILKFEPPDPADLIEEEEESGDEEEEDWGDIGDEEETPAAAKPAGKKAAGKKAAGKK